MDRIRIDAVEPSDFERADWPDATRDYVEALENAVEALQSAPRSPAQVWAKSCGRFETRGQVAGGGCEIWVTGEQQSAVAHVTRRHDDAGPPETVAALICDILNAASDCGGLE
jgi:hypothetical protein